MDSLGDKSPLTPRHLCLCRARELRLDTQYRRLELWVRLALSLSLLLSLSLSLSPCSLSLSLFADLVCVSVSVSFRLGHVMRGLQRVLNAAAGQLDKRCHGLALVATAGAACEHAAKEQVPQSCSPHAAGTPALQLRPLHT